MEIVDMIWGYIAPVWNWLLEGVAAYGPHTAGGDINWMFLGLQMGVIALVMALLMQQFGAILIFTVVAVIVHVAVDIALPMVRAGAGFEMPPVTDMAYLQYLAFAAVGYLIAITVLSMIKSIVLPR
ncbi:hypothetical protein F1654_02530 [Alkalicaulis satelles]|uniref:Uncharacterized protein n=1 Tax=Alkalicaulis satelles TaxID=2609175 RepID=A0A5M6ZJA9_9PROT|nr:hypothetical protein [Alkalicaulis satelles]KAA5804893.1 hypothetical protein F1654_02530 [Alkalicaulis satelles]